MLDNTVQDALLRLTQRAVRGGRLAVATDRAASLTRMLGALPVMDAGEDSQECDCVSLVRAALALADAPDQVAQDVIAVVSACRDSERVSQASAVVAILVRANAQAGPVRQDLSVRVVGA